VRDPDGNLVIDTILQGRYRIIKLVDIGPISRMYKGYDMKLKKYIFVKELIATYKDTYLRQQAIEQFKSEAKIIFKLNHENLPKFGDYFDCDESRYLITEYIEGKRLNSIVESQKDYLDEKQVIDWALELCDVLSYLHKIEPNPVIFRDMSPYSIMLSDCGKLKLIDFGISKVYEIDAITRGIARSATPYYSPIEQILGGTDIRSDIYSLGATIYYLLTKEPPMDAMDRSYEDEPMKSCREINPDVSPALDRIIMTAMEMDKRDRYQDVDEIKSDLLKILEYRAQSTSVLSEKTSLQVIPSSSSQDMTYKRYRRLSTHSLPVTDNLPKGKDITSLASVVDEKIFPPPKKLDKDIKKIDIEITLEESVRKGLDLKQFKPRTLAPSLNVSDRLKEIRKPQKKVKLEQDIPVLNEGEIIIGRYRVEELIRENPLSKVYKGIDLRKNHIIAIKELFIDILLKPEEREQAIEKFHAETRMLLQLSHPNLPGFEDYFTLEGRNYLIMEYIEGKTILSIIENCYVLPSWEYAVEWCLQLCSVLGYLHSRKPKPIIFRGLCPENIMLDDSNLIKLIDFGIAKLYDSNERTLSVSKVATTHFSPPEQYSGQTDSRSDIYSLGATLYYILTGKVPPDSVDRVMYNIPFSPKEFSDEIPSILVSLVLKAMETEKEKRFQQISEIEEYLRNL